MRAASAANDEAMAWLVEQVRPGVTELAIAEGLLGTYRRLGAEDHSFSPIVSFGPNAADPHHEPDETPLAAGDMVLFDVGCKRDWYCSDMTRTFFTAEPTEHQRAVYETVLRANEAAEAIVRPGVTFAEIDLTARRIIEDAGWGPQFNHRLGHQIGLQDHEPGDVSATHDEPVQPGASPSSRVSTCRETWGLHRGPRHRDRGLRGAQPRYPKGADYRLAEKATGRTAVPVLRPGPCVRDGAPAHAALQRLR